MSYYYNYFIGYAKDGKIYPWGPYDAKGKLNPAIVRSRSFASDLHEDFSPVPEKKISDELRKEFEYEDWDGTKRFEVKYLPVKDLPTGTYIKTGYFLINDVINYEKSNDETFEDFYNVISPEVYAAKLQQEMMFGKNQPQKDAEGYEYTEPNASDYMYYACPNYLTREYEAAVLRMLVGILEDYQLGTGVEYVILETEG